MQTSQPNAEAARLAKLKVPQLRKELGTLGLVKRGNKAALIQRLLAQPVVHTLHFRCRNELGEIEDVNVQLSTQEEFDKFAPWGADLFSASWTTRRRVTRILTISMALAVMADPNLYLSQQYPFDETIGTVNNLAANRQNTAHGLEQECNRAAEKSLPLRQLLGKLKLVNDGHSVKFKKKNKNDNFDDVMEVDGILLNHKVVVMNEVKNSPSPKNVAKCAGRWLMFESLLSKIAATPDDYKTEPEAVRDELVEWMTASDKEASDINIQCMISGYDFSTDAQNDCRARSMHVTRSQTATATP
jgi:hypothetical protein